MIVLYGEMGGTVEDVARIYAEGNCRLEIRVVEGLRRGSHDNQIKLVYAVFAVRSDGVLIDILQKDLKGHRTVATADAALQMCQQIDPDVCEMNVPLLRKDNVTTFKKIQL